jgi:hypothetical protein
MYGTILSGLRHIFNFVPAHYFFFDTHWAKQFFYETLVCFGGVPKPSYSDGFATCFSIEFLFPKIYSKKNDSLDFNTQGASASILLLTIPKAVIFLARRQICKYADKQSGTFLFGWCLMCICGFLQVFVGAQTTNTQIQFRFRISVK